MVSTTTYYHNMLQINISLFRHNMTLLPHYAKVNTPGIIKLKAFGIKLFIHLIITMIVLYVGDFGYSLPIFFGVTMLLFCIEYAIVCFCWEIGKVIKQDGLIKGLLQAIILLLILASIPYFSKK